MISTETRTMKPLATSSKKIVWTKPDPAKNQYVFRDGDDVVAKLEWKEDSAHGEWHDGSVVMKKAGFLNPHIVVKKSKGGEILGRFEPTMGGGGIVQLTDGRSYTWISHAWQADWHWVTTAGEMLLRFSYTGFAVDGSPEGMIEIAEQTPRGANLPAALLLGCYIIHLVAESGEK
jgi:hypothetical protein